jgi:membrane-associated protease RseP (regulator of RpoE activity)
MFWLAMGIIGWQNENMGAVLIFIGCGFLSILVHEYGHGLTARRFGSPASILLWVLGGLCYNNADRQTPAQRLTVLACGPGAGFVLCAVVMIVYSALFGLTLEEHLAFVARFLWLPSDVESALPKLAYVDDPHALNPRFEIYWDLVQINIRWGLLNLLPIWPLDGGQICATVLSQVNPFHGRRWTHVISLLTSGLIVVVVYSLTQSLRSTIFFAYFAVINYQMLDSIHRAQSLGLYDDDRWRT